MNKDDLRSQAKKEKNDEDDGDLLKELIGSLISAGLEEELTARIAAKIKELEAR